MSKVNYMWRLTKEEYGKTNPWHPGYTDYQHCLADAINASCMPSPLVFKLKREEVPFEIVTYEIKKTENFVNDITIGDTPMDIHFNIKKGN